jgi:hypothetical protein
LPTHHYPFIVDIDFTVLPPRALTRKGYKTKKLPFLPRVDDVYMNIMSESGVLPVRAESLSMRVAVK